MKYIFRFKFEIIGILSGGVLGYLYYHFIGCSNGSCAITSSPYLSSMYGAAVGGLIFNSFSTSKTKKTIHMGFLSMLLGMGPTQSVDFKELVQKKGAIIVDVRTPEEFKSGHINKSINIPLNVIANKAEELKKKNKPIILVCRSGARSGSALGILKSKGISEVYNGGGWTSLQSQIQ